MKFATLLLLCKYCGELHDFIMVVDCYQGCCYYKLLTFSMGKKVGHLSCEDHHHLHRTVFNLKQTCN